MTPPPPVSGSATSPMVANSETEQRHGLLARMINAVRNVAVVNALSDWQLHDAVEDWDDVLSEVPTDDLEELRRRGLREVRRYDGDGKPERPARNALDFLNFWRAEQNVKDEAARDEERRNRDAQWHQRIQSGEVLDGIGYIAAQLQWKQRMMNGNLAVCCDCKDKDGYHLPAFLSPDRTHWVCRYSVMRAQSWCEFRWPVADMQNAPNRGQIGPLVVAMPAIEAPRIVVDPGRLAAQQCDFDFDAFSPLQVAQFRGFVKWWNDKYQCELSRDHFDEYFPVWLKEQEEKTKETLQQ